ncbi:MAG: DUF6624 domain-containing protein [Planctomycetota bacterium]
MLPLIALIACLQSPSDTHAEPADAITVADVERVTPTEADRARFRAAIEQIAIDDQKHRTAISWGTTDPEELAELEALDDDAHIAEWARRNAEGIKLEPAEESRLWELQNELDYQNTRVLMNLVERFGWPSEEMLGEGTPDMTAVLIHMRPGDAAWVLPVLKREAITGRMDPKNYAMIFDRKRQHDGQPQLYGTARMYDRATNSVLPPEVVDIDKTNAARAEIGLGPLESFRIAGAES